VSMLGSWYREFLPRPPDSAIALDANRTLQLDSRRMRAPVTARSLQCAGSRAAHGADQEDRTSDATGLAILLLLRKRHATEVWIPASELRDHASCFRLRICASVSNIRTLC